MTSRKTRRESKCKKCGKSLFGISQARRLQEIGLCKKCLPDEYKCKAKTQRGTLCSLVAISGSEFCRQHRKHSISINQTTKKISYSGYYEYINSKEWKEKSKSRKAAVGWRCQLCNKRGTTTSLHAHHRTYLRLGNERDDDITILCSNCHAKFHDKLIE